jgi:hypothetical protein
MNDEGLVVVNADPDFWQIQLVRIQRWTEPMLF